MKPLFLALLIASLPASAALAAGSYTGPGAARPATTVAAARGAADETPVVLEGEIVQRLKGDTYEFRDATGTVKVEIDDEDWPDRAVDDQTRVRLTGEMESELLQHVIDVERVEVLD